MYDELGDETVELMKTVKAAIDPLNIMNPGKACSLNFLGLPITDHDFLALS